MKSTPLIINWHESNAPIYSADFQRGDKGRLATAGGDNNVRLWKLESEGDDRSINYLATLSKHSQAVNCVRWAPRGDVLASAGDDGNIILWALDEGKTAVPVFGGDGTEDKEVWKTRHMCRSSGAEIYDLAWSPDAMYFIIGSMDNVARIYNAQTGHLVRQIAEHQHYVQGVAWDPLNEYIATQSSDRSVHIYSLKTKDGQFTLDNRDVESKLAKVGSNLRMDLPGRRISSNSPAPPDMGFRAQLQADTSSIAAGSPTISCPGTPQSLALPMNPPSVVSHSRRSSFGASSPAMSMRRSASPAPSMPLPAVMLMESPKPSYGLGVKNSHIYANDTLKSFFRRLTFTPDGGLLLTPAGQYQIQQRALDDGPKTLHEVINTVYIYTRGGINKPPIAHLPSHKKPSVAVKCSPIYYTIRKYHPQTKHIIIDTSSTETMTALPEPVIAKSPSNIMEPPPPVPQDESTLEKDVNATISGPSMAFSLPYRMIYAVATEDSVLLYDTQQQTPLCIVSNLHCATFTDLSWARDGLTLLMTSSDGFCSTLTFAEGELGKIYPGEVPTSKHPHLSTAVSSSQNTPIATPTSNFAPPSPFRNPGHQRTLSNVSVAPSPPPAPVVPSMKPSSPTRSNSVSSVITQNSSVNGSGTIVSNPTLVGGSVSGPVAGTSGLGLLPMSTPPETPRSAASSISGVKRDASESEQDEGSQEKKKRRIAPTPV
ncbi:WD40-repeat-containing domain protein [Calycina marina]|uniref:WD40-repeat-containing domain protein n=1 Tax=Calycina marina TaxID=1763456 RepID=A0A9P8CDQ7_9HELO|nr:WD40-repeat-containing domain protein [Calycina marina]